MKVTCGAKTRNGTPCKRAPMSNGRCKLHGGASLRGAAHPNFKTGERSKYMPKDMAGMYGEVDNSALATLEDNLKLTETLLRQRLESLHDMPDSMATWKAMDKALDKIGKAYAAMSDPLMSSAMIQARNAVDEGKRRLDAIADIRSMMGDQRADIKTKADIEYKQQQVLTANEAVNLAAGIAGILLELHIEKTKINEFLIRLDSLIQPQYKTPILTDDT